MFLLDIETLGSDGNSVILSAAVLHVDTSIEKHTISSLRRNSMFVKFKVREQVEKYHRVVDQNTIEWWNRQTDEVRKISFFPKKGDLSAEVGIEILRDFMKSKSPNYLKSDVMWTRGNLDSVVLDSLCKSVGVKPLMPYWSIHNIRTFLYLNTETVSYGYSEIDVDQCTGFKKDDIIKHNPVDDIVYDALQMLYGK